MAIVLTDRERAVLAYMVVDPDGWVAHAEAEMGEDGARVALAAKVVRWGGAFDAALAADGAAYQTRAERERA